MGALAPDQLTPVFRDGVCELTMLFSIKNTTAADTLDLAGYFKVVKRAGIVSATGTTIAACTITGNTGVTIPAGPAADGVWLLAVGVAA